MTPENWRDLKVSIVEFPASEDWARMEKIYDGNYMEGWKDALDWMKDIILELEEK